MPSTAALPRQSHERPNQPAPGATLRRPWKDYHNDLYTDVPPDRWTSGLCCIFANALNERFGLPMEALVVESTLDGVQLLVHAFAAFPDGRKVDGVGIRSEAEIMTAYSHLTNNDWRAMACLGPTEGIRVYVRQVELSDLWDLNPEDHEATNAAHAYIDEHPELFADLHALERARAAAELPNLQTPRHQSPPNAR